MAAPQFNRNRLPDSHQDIFAQLRHLERTELEVTEPGPLAPTAQRVLKKNKGAVQTPIPGCLGRQFGRSFAFYIYGFRIGHFLTKKNKNRRRQKRHNRRSRAKAPSHGLGASIGAKLGGWAEKGIGRLFGFGEYQEALEKHVGSSVVVPEESPQMNSIVAPLSSNDLVPVMHAYGEGSVVIRRREFVKNVDIATGETLLTFQVNPGSRSGAGGENLFPWLSQIAPSYQSFQIAGLSIEYVPLSGYAVSSDSAALGTVGISFVYDNISDTYSEWPYTSFESLLNLSGAVSGTPATPMSCYLECDPKTRLRNAQLVRTHQSIADPNYSRQDFDYAALAIRTGGSQNATKAVCGQIWVTYEILLHLPRVPDPFVGTVVEYIDPVWQPLLLDLRALLNVKGGQTDKEIIDRNEAIALIRAQMAGIPYRLAYAQAEAALQRSALNPPPPEEVVEELPAILARLNEGKEEYVPVRASSSGVVKLSSDALIDPTAFVSIDKAPSGWQTIRNRSRMQSPAPSTSG